MIRKSGMAEGGEERRKGEGGREGEREGGGER